MELYIIRHGQSLNNSLDDSSRRVCDPPLTKAGEAQAERVAEHLKTASAFSGKRQPEGAQHPPGYGITRIFCSAHLRAMQTAAPIADALGIHPEVWIDIHEEWGIWLDHGDGRGPVGLPGMARSEITARFPNYVLPDAISEEGWWNRPPESPDEWTVRAARVAQELRDRFAATEERIALVTHGGFTNDLLHAILNGGPIEGVYFSHRNTAISRLDYQDGGEVQVVYLNRMEHLPLELVT